MARVPLVDHPEGALVALYADIAGLRGSVLNLYQALGNQPEALRAFMVMSRHVRDDSTLAPRLRELAVLATAYALDVPYERYHHVRIARNVGISDQQLAARRHLSEGEIVDLALTVGWYHLCAAILGPLRIETEDVPRG
jgi:alkylhydroperoxidase family enzyme